ncbi:hypothetical protein BC941DRAFT_454946 [Chlamydoabsidia padenii]|nr:hypothetical protein BC941DRAFT_454946 [Chlamydoabsidia padenii]
MGLLKRLPSLSFKGLYKSSEQPPSSTKAKPDDYALSSQVNSWTDPSAGTSFFDDIFMELGQSLPTQSLPTIQDTDTNMTPTQLDSPSISPNSHNTVLSTPTNEPFLPSIPTNLDSDVSEDEDEDNGTIPDHGTTPSTQQQS